MFQLSGWPGDGHDDVHRVSTGGEKPAKKEKSMMTTQTQVFVVWVLDGGEEGRGKREPARGDIIGGIGGQGGVVFPGNAHKGGRQGHIRWIDEMVERSNS